MTTTPSNSLKIGLDFGTTNSVVVLAHPDGRTETARFTFPHHGASETCRTLLCFWHDEEGSRMKLHEGIGAAAVDAYLEDPAESRMIMSMKSYLAQKSFRETQIFSRRMTLEMLIARFLTHLMQAVKIDPASVQVTVGRPVHFAGDRADDALGEQRLRDSFTAAGFAPIGIAWEPEAAGWRFAQRLEKPTTILVGDFGGGTSDFSVLRFDPATGRATPLGHAASGLRGISLITALSTPSLLPCWGGTARTALWAASPYRCPLNGTQALATGTVWP